MQGPDGERAFAGDPPPPPLQAQRIQAPSSWQHPPTKPHPPLNMEESESAGASKVQQLFEAELGSGPRPLPDELRAARSALGAASRCARSPPLVVARAAGPLLSCTPALLCCRLATVRFACVCREREEVQFKVAAGRSLDYQAVPWAGAWFALRPSSRAQVAQGRVAAKPP